jgi:hypothetical protein
MLVIRTGREPSDTVSSSNVVDRRKDKILI